MGDSKACSRCSTVRDLGDFPRDKRRVDGRHGVCLPCKRQSYASDPVRREIHRARQRAYDAERRDERREKARVAYWADPDKFRARNAQNHLKHRAERNLRAAQRRTDPQYAERARAASAAWRRADPERASRSERQSRLRHRRAVADRNRRWREAHPDRVRYYHAKRQKGLRQTALPFTGEQLKARLSFYGNRCWMCRGPFDHLDHVKPVSKGGPHMLANLRPACQTCNCSKKDKWGGALWTLLLVK